MAVILAALFVCPCPGYGQGGNADYCNDLYSYCIAYPKDILTPQPESDLKDGRIFTDSKGAEVLRVFGRNNADPDFGKKTLAKQYQIDLDNFLKEHPGAVLTYEKLSREYFVISGTAAGKVYYRKAISNGTNFAYIMLQYDEKDKKRYDKVAENLSQSLKWVNP